MGQVLCGTDKEIKLAPKEGGDGRRGKIKVKPLLNRSELDKAHKGSLLPREGEQSLAKRDFVQQVTFARLWQR